MMGITLSVDPSGEPGGALVTSSADLGALLRRYLDDDPTLTATERTAAGMVVATLEQGGTLEHIRL